MIEKIEYWTANHYIYFDIALANYEIVNRTKTEFHTSLQSIREKFKNDEGVPDQEWRFFADKHNTITRATPIVIIFSALTVESYINYYATTRLSKSYLKNYLDRLDILSKWIVIPRVITGKQLHPGSKPIQDLSWLIKLRNELAHFKPRKAAPKYLDDPALLEFGYETKKAIGAVRNLVTSLGKIDDKAEVGWVNWKLGQL